MVSTDALTKFDKHTPTKTPIPKVCQYKVSAPHGVNIVIKFSDPRLGPEMSPDVWGSLCCQFGGVNASQLNSSPFCAHVAFTRFRAKLSEIRNLNEAPVLATRRGCNASAAPWLAIRTACGWKCSVGNQRTTKQKRFETSNPHCQRVCRSKALAIPQTTCRAPGAQPKLTQHLLCFPDAAAAHAADWSCHWLRLWLQQATSYRRKCRAGVETVWGSCGCTSHTVSSPVSCCSGRVPRLSVGKLLPQSL
jgi:hypothetical protein